MLRSVRDFRATTCRAAWQASSGRWTPRGRHGARYRRRRLHRDAGTGWRVGGLRCSFDGFRGWNGNGFDGSDSTIGTRLSGWVCAKDFVPADGPAGFRGACTGGSKDVRAGAGLRVNVRSGVEAGEVSRSGVTIGGRAHGCAAGQSRPSVRPPPLRGNAPPPEHQPARGRPWTRPNIRPVVPVGATLPRRGPTFLHPPQRGNAGRIASLMARPRRPRAKSAAPILHPVRPRCD